jgi:hypothetical protein
MRRTPYPVLVAIPLLLIGQLLADGNASKASSTRPLTFDTRLTIVRMLSAEFVRAKKMFPQGEKGLTIRNGVVAPDDRTLVAWAANLGPAARPGERAQITNIEFRNDRIIFEINGGPRKKPKWWQRLQIASAGGSTPLSPGPDPNANGSFVALVFDRYVPDLGPSDVKQMLAPVFEFGAGRSATQQYGEGLPPKLRAALKEHRALVGMNREMVIEAIGRPSQKVREKDGEVEYEEWIYGIPPADMQFIRFVGDEVTRVELMQQNGTKIVRTEREVDLPAAGDAAAVAQAEPARTNAASKDQRPSLRRAGEEAPAGSTTVGPQSAPVMLPPDAGQPRLPDGSTPQDSPGTPPH